MLRVDVAVTGKALLTPLAHAGTSTFDVILAGRRLLDRGVMDPQVLAAATADLPETARVLAHLPGLDRCVRMAALVAHRAMTHAGWAASTLADERTMLFVGTSKGPVLAQLAAAEALRRDGVLADLLLARQAALGPHAIATLLREHLGIGGGAHTSVAACASGLFALHRAARAIRAGECDRALVVAADASVHPLFEGSFQRLGVLARPDADGHRRCEPFHPEGRGFFLTEAAAAVTLEPAGPGSSLILTRTWTGGDGTHLIAMDPNTVTLRQGLRHCINQKAPAFIHAHATGTPHDLHERAAIEALARSVPVFSHKRWLGHSLGAAGLVSLVLSAECHDRRVTLTGQAVPPHARSITIAQGFGGHIALAVLES